MGAYLVFFSDLFPQKKPLTLKTVFICSWQVVWVQNRTRKTDVAGTDDGTGGAIAVFLCFPHLPAYLERGLRVKFDEAWDLMGNESTPCCFANKTPGELNKKWWPIQCCCIAPWDTGHLGYARAGAFWSNLWETLGAHRLVGAGVLLAVAMLG